MPQAGLFVCRNNPDPRGWAEEGGQPQNEEDLSQSSALVNDLKMVEVAGVEPAGGGASIPVNKRGSELSPEALTHILTNFTDVDRRMLSQIAERWGGLSDELKGAVLAVVGSHLLI